jgi:hypothetical protein
MGIVAAVGVRRMWRNQKSEAAFFSLWLIFFLFIVGFADKAGMKSIHPYRYIMPFWMLIYGLASFEISRRLGDTLRIPLAILAVLFGGALTFGAVRGEAYCPRLTNQWPEFQKEFIRYLETGGKVPGRMLMECRELGDPHYMEYLAFRTHQQFLGGPFGAYFLISKFTLFVTGTRPVIFERFLKDFDEKEFKDYLDLYNVSRIAVTSSQAADLLRKFNGILIESPSVGSYRMFQVKELSGWFVQGTGDVDAELDRIRIHGASPGMLVLKYHWISTLKTVPSLPMKPVHLKDDPVPFIQIDNDSGAKDIEILNEGL